MKKIEPFGDINKIEWISLFRVNKEMSNEEILQHIYLDLSKKCDFIKSIYPFSGGNLTTYTRIFKMFGIKYSFLTNNLAEFYSDTFKESKEAFENGIFNVERDFFGSGEWPIIFFIRLSDNTSDTIAYTISR